MTDLTERNALEAKLANLLAEISAVQDRLDEIDAEAYALTVDPGEWQTNGTIAGVGSE